MNSRVPTQYCSSATAKGNQASCQNCAYFLKKYRVHRDGTSSNKAAGSSTTTVVTMDVWNIRKAARTPRSWAQTTIAAHGSSLREGER
mmetsp:Transcript_52227/g.169684  ORF Transcript_52227/g.169684 Transcript_52227/m.169684 type:complete len:88 (+) Transcript_52227:1108-1371(+)